MGGGAEKVLNQLVNGLKKDFDITIAEKTGSIYCYDNDIDVNVLSPMSLSDEKVKDKGHFIKLNSKLKRWLISILMYLFPKWIHRKYIGKADFDFEVSFNYLYVSYLVGNSPNPLSKKIMWVHTDINDLKYWNAKNFLLKLKTFFYFQLQKKAFVKGDKIVAISKNTYDSIIELFPMVKPKVFLIYNGYDFNEFVKKSNEYNPPAKTHKLRFVTAGRLDERKNHALMLSAMILLKDFGIDFELILMGDGEKYEELMEYTLRNKLENNIFFNGFTSNPYPIIKTADVFLLSSLAEGFPTVIVEALCMGVPVVTTPVGGTLELIKRGVNGAISEFSAESFCNCIIDVIDGQYDKNEIRNSVLEYSLENWVKNIKDKLLLDN